MLQRPGWNRTRLQAHSTGTNRTNRRRAVGRLFQPEGEQSRSPDVTGRWCVIEAGRSVRVGRPLYYDILSADPSRQGRRGVNIQGVHERAQCAQRALRVCKTCRSRSRDESESQVRVVVRVGGSKVAGGQTVARRQSPGHGPMVRDQRRSKRHGRSSDVIRRCRHDPSLASESAREQGRG